jgi:hypothetical protein
MKYLIIFVVCLSPFSFAQYNSNNLQKFVKEVNRNLERIQKQGKDLIHSNEYFGLTEKEVISPFYDYEFEILEPFQISKEGNIFFKLKYLKEENPFTYQIDAPLDKLLNYGVDIYFILNFEDNQVRIVQEDATTGETTAQYVNFFHLGVDQTKMRQTAEKAGIKEGYYYP